VKKRTSDPWIPGDRYGRLLPPFMARGHGWREVMVEDADGYVWTVGVPADSPLG